jgi:hypothetical protein
MDMLLYFAIGALNIVLLYIMSNWYKRESGIDLFPGRENKDRGDIIISIICYFISGPFGTMMLVLLGVFLLNLWLKYYRKK